MKEKKQHTQALEANPSPLWITNFSGVYLEKGQPLE
jgi:hypothetical protein